MQHTTVTIDVDADGIVIRHPLFEPREVTWDDIGSVSLSADFTDIEMSSMEEALPKSMSNSMVEINEKRDPDSNTSNGESGEQVPLTTDVEGSDNSAKSKIQRFANTVSAEYDKEEQKFILSEGNEGGNQFTEFVDSLFEFGFLDKSDLPWATPRANKHYVLNTVPKDQNGEEMPNYTELRDGIFLYTKPPIRSKEKYANLLFQEFVIED